MSKQVRIGIDVGGTYTDGIVIDNQTGEIIAKEKILTTHYAKEGVALGITQILQNLLEKNNIKPEDVVFIAHGTTQATNALLEGDVAPVGVIGIGDSKRAEHETQIENIELAKGKYLTVHHEFIYSKDLNNTSINKAIDRLIEKGAKVIVASGAYSVENPEKELLVIDLAKKRGIFATAGHEISELFGLKVRTRTAAINASLIPKMIETATMTEQAIKKVGIKSDLMVMRADGGVMSLKEVQRRPILTLLSGLAAGVAGVLLYGKVTEGIFLEIGGTSIDVSVIKDGKVMLQNARIGKYKTFIKSLDVRTLAVAGGTMIRIGPKGIVDVGPRSSHLAKMDYECFTTKKVEDDTAIQVRSISPLPGDSDDYAIAELPDGSTFAYTLAGAANVLGIIPENDYAYGSKEKSILFWGALGAKFGKTAEEMATTALDKAFEKVWSEIEELIKEYELDPSYLRLIGGGGSASVLTPYIAKKKGIKCSIIENAPYISTIGVALAMIREQIERSVVNPSTEDIKKIREDVLNKIIEMGAIEDTVEISVEVDSQKHIIVATATGATELKKRDYFTKNLNEEQIQEKVVESLGNQVNNLKKIGEAGIFHGYVAEKRKSGFLNFLNKKEVFHVVANDEGVILFRKTNSYITLLPKHQVDHVLPKLMEEHSTYSVAGQSVPSVYMFSRGRVFNYSGLVTVEQIMSVFKIDFAYYESDEKVMILLVKK